MYPRTYLPTGDLEDILFCHTDTASEHSRRLRLGGRFCHASSESPFRLVCRIHKKPAARLTLTKALEWTNNEQEFVPCHLGVWSDLGEDGYVVRLSHRIFVSYILHGERPSFRRQSGQRITTSAHLPYQENKLSCALWKIVKYWLFVINFMVDHESNKWNLNVVQRSLMFHSILRG